LKLLRTYPKDSSWCEEADCITRSKPQYFLKRKPQSSSFIHFSIMGNYPFILFYISLTHSGFRSLCVHHEKVHKNNDPSSGKPCFVLLMSSLCKYARDFEINQITTVQLRITLITDLVKITVSYFFFAFDISTVFFDDAMCSESILVYKTSTEPCGFDSVYSDSQP